ncbi:2-phospho-L-lactate guanylyltransferase [Novosphingobium endophyticum]|uniref:3-phospho-D-glycerate guanylyltransferase n=1 Tax=Novosphingobium endophyticum TaxID=1955250 RepID=A0A916X4D6_9SPHN|nr:2-phospho-L-lactate guanylyltransferase [Novosphingobium endophyticum]GGB99315.1 2-phospho-L-lactate guanylyltransferase [Novosphingobium endophyticum]
MTCWAIIPIKGKGQGKSRLAGALSEGEREALVDAMLAHVVDAARQARLIERVLLVGPSRHGLDETIPLLADAGKGLNAALRKALAQVASDGPERLLVVAGDLPCVTALDLDLLASVPAETVGIAPDRHGTGTNALSLPLPQAARFTFHFGTDSRARHWNEAEKLGLTVETIHSAGLEKDIDERADLSDAAQVFSPVR